jgi:YD repeat-containing protein
MYVAIVCVVVALAGRGLSGWLKNNAKFGEARIAQFKHRGPVARLDELKGSGTIYLVQIGDHKDPYAIEDFAQWLRTKYKLDVRLLPALPLDASGWNPLRGQYSGEALNGQMERAYPDLAANGDAYLIGFTDVDMYTEQMHWKGTFTLRGSERAAIISSDGMQDDRWQRRWVDAKTANEQFRARLRRILLKDVALQYWHLRMNSDRTSLLHDTLDPDVPTEDIYESDLDRALSAKGDDVEQPCIFFDSTVKDGIRPRVGPLIRTCAEVPDPDEDEGVERFEVFLRWGEMFDKRTDLFRPDTIPIAFQQVMKPGWKGINSFGISGSDSYDDYLSSADNIVIDVDSASSQIMSLTRQPRWISDLSVVKYVIPTDPGYFELRWRPTPFEHYDLKRFDGEVRQFLPCNGPTVWCYLIDVKNGQGQELKFERGAGRRLMRLTSPHGHWVSLAYDDRGRIATATEDRGRTVHYGYDARDRLISVTHPSGEVCRYEYDDAQRLLTFSDSADGIAPARVLLRNEYMNGLLTKQTLGDGSVYLYAYDGTDAANMRAVTVHASDGQIYEVTMSPTGSVVREHSAELPIAGRIDRQRP